MTGNGRRVGVVGLGRMGGPMAGHLAAAGYDVLGYDPDPNVDVPGPGAGWRTWTRSGSATSSW